MTYTDKNIQDWLQAKLDPSIQNLSSEEITGGNSNGVLRLNFSDKSGPRSLVLRVSGDSIIVDKCDAGREGKILAALNKAGAPVPEVHLIDAEGALLGNPGFIMDMIEGRGFPDETEPSYHGEGWYRDADLDTQRSTWFGFIDMLADLHNTEVADVPEMRLIPQGPRGYLDYWKESLLGVVPADEAKRTLAILDWLYANLPKDAEQNLTICMADARAANCLLPHNGASGALIDFEVCYFGNPLGDLAYTIVSDEICRMISDRPAQGVPTIEETTNRWHEQTGRSVTDISYWKAFSFAVLGITIFRVLLSKGLPVQGIEAMHPFLDYWDSLIAQASA